MSHVFPRLLYLTETPPFSVKRSTSPTTPTHYTVNRNTNNTKYHQLTRCEVINGWKTTMQFSWHGSSSLVSFSNLLLHVKVMESTHEIQQLLCLTESSLQDHFMVTIVTKINAVCRNASYGLSAIITELYRATLCVSAVFAVAGCPSVRLSVNLLWIISRRLKISSNLFLCPVAWWFWVFLIPSADTYTVSSFILRTHTLVAQFNYSQIWKVSLHYQQNWQN